MKKNPGKKFKDGNLSVKSTRQMRTQVDTTQSKKQKETINKNQVKTQCKEDSRHAL
jgi:hypothetical protein